jgi:hypothetical protein
MAVFTTAGSIHDDAYRPILRPRRGELAALSHLAPGDAARVMPILELEPGPSIVPLIRQLPPRPAVIAIDLGALPDPDDPLATPTLDLAEALADLGLAVLPVLRPQDSDRRLAAHGLAARMHLRRAVLRLQPHIDAGNPAAADAVTDRVLRRAGLEAEEVDLLIDLAETACMAHADEVEERARRVVRWARGLPWRSVSVASGAMPPNLDDLPPDVPVAVGRLDARVWQRLGEPGIGYADYGVTSPVRRLGVQRHRQLPPSRTGGSTDGRAGAGAATTAATTCAARWSRRRTGRPRAPASRGATPRSPGGRAPPRAAAARARGWRSARRTTSPTSCKRSPTDSIRIFVVRLF